MNATTFTLKDLIDNNYFQFENSEKLSDLENYKNLVDQISETFKKCEVDKFTFSEVSLEKKHILLLLENETLDKDTEKTKKISFQSLVEDWGVTNL